MNHDSDGIRHSFKWLNITQFLGALNDNIFRWVVVFFIADAIGGGQDESTFVIPLVTGIFVLPFLLFSHAAGVMADRYSKRDIIVLAKYAELAIMTFGCVAIYYRSEIALYVLIFVMSTQSAIFGPSKYGIIPELVGKKDLSKVNGFLVGLTYLAIVMGTFVPSYLLDVIMPGGHLGVATLCVFFAAIGVFASLGIERTPAGGVGETYSFRFVSKMFGTMRYISKDRDLFMAVLGTIYFLFLGGFAQQALILYGHGLMGESFAAGGLLFPMTALGIGMGGLLAGKLSGRNIEFGVVPIGAFGLMLFCILLGVIPASKILALTMVFFLGVSSGLFSVPLNAFIQYQSPRSRLGEILACSAFFQFLGVAVSAALVYTLHEVVGMTPANMFIVCGILTGILAVWAIIVLPDFLIRFVVVVITRVFYRIKTNGLENIPLTGSALLVSNHVTWVDALLICATTQRRIRFMMAREIYERRWIRPLYKLMKVIPISPTDPPRQVVESLKQARRSLDDGCLVCIFAEGAITRNGNMREFKPGLERIIKGSDHPVIPVHIGGAWGSIFSYRDGKLFSRWPRELPYNVSIAFGPGMPSTSSTHEVRMAVLELSQYQFDVRKSPARSLPRMFIRTARRRWFHTALADTTGKDLSFGNALISAIALGWKIKAIAGDTEKIGVVMPASVGGALTNLAISILGRIPVNLNFTSSSEAIQSAVAQCGIKTVITSRKFMEKLESFEALEGTVYIEDIAASISKSDKLRAAICAILAPSVMIMNWQIPAPDDIATIIFSSGSTGMPKGVMLSHHNIVSNIEGIVMVYELNTADRMCGVLPFFHSFGYTVTLWAPMVMGFAAYYHANPVEGTKVAELVRSKKLTILLSTPTFLLAYIRRAKREDFETLRAVVVGAEKLKTKVANAFEDRFGLRPLEGYGATELSPVGALNVHDAEIDGVSQVGRKEGSIGHPLPGIAMRIVDPDSLMDIPLGDEGLLLVKGPNVMLGYLGMQEKTSEVIQGGWYNTGDIAKIDSDGFVFLLDRMARYSKIGGEMVPHIAVEDKIFAGLDTMNPVVFVTAAPDEKRGEQLVVLHTEEAGSSEYLRGIVKNSDIPNLWKPRNENYLMVDTMPLLGSGKFDLRKMKEIAREFIEDRPGVMERVMTKIREAI